MFFVYITYITKHHVIFKQCHPSEARYGRSRRILTVFSRDAEPHRLEAHGHVVRPVQADRGVHAPLLAAVARQCGLD